MTDGLKYAVNKGHYLLGVLFVSLFVLSVPGGSQEIYVVRSSAPLKLILSSIWVFFSIVLLVQLFKSKLRDILPPTALLVAFMIILSVGVVINDVDFRHLANGIYVVYFWLIVLSFAMVCRPIERARESIVLGVIVVGSLCAGVSVLQMIKASPLVFPEYAELRLWSVSFYGRYRAHSFFSSAVPNGALMIISAVLVMDRITSIFEGDANKDVAARVSVYAILFGLLLAGIYATHTRAVYGTFVVAVASYFIVVVRPARLIGFSVLAAGISIPLAIVLFSIASGDFYSLDSFLARRDILREIDNITFYLDWRHQLFGLLTFTLDSITYYYSVIDNGYVIIRLASGAVGLAWFFVCYTRLLLLAKMLSDQEGGRVMLPILLAQLFAFVFNNPIHMSFAVLALLSIVGVRANAGAVGNSSRKDSPAEGYPRAFLRS